jgi:hypothetical protein
MVGVVIYMFIVFINLRKIIGKIIFSHFAWAYCWPTGRQEKRNSRPGAYGLLLSGFNAATKTGYLVLNVSRRAPTPLTLEKKVSQIVEYRSTEAHANDRWARFQKLF